MTTRNQVINLLKSTSVEAVTLLSPIDTKIERQKALKKLTAEALSMSEKTITHVVILLHHR